MKKRKLKKYPVLPVSPSVLKAWRKKVEEGKENGVSYKAMLIEGGISAPLVINAIKHGRASELVVKKITKYFDKIK